MKPKEQDFFTAVLAGDTDLIGSLLNQGVNINAIDDDGLTALHIAAEKGDIIVGRCLLKRKNLDVDTHTFARNGDSALITAVTFNRVRFTTLLLHIGANPNIRNTFGRTALHSAVRRKCIVMVKTLLYSKAQPNIVDAFGNTPLSLSIIEYPCKRIAEILFNWGANPNQRTMKPHPLLLELALNCTSIEHIRMMKLLIEHDADVNIINPISKQTALHMASITGYVPVAQLLLKSGAIDTSRDLCGRTPFDMAVEHGHSKLIEFYKDRDRAVKAIIQSIAFTEEGHSSSMTKRKNSTAPRSVRFSGAKRTGSENELYSEHL